MNVLQASDAEKHHEKKRFDDSRFFILHQLTEQLYIINERKFFCQMVLCETAEW